MATIDTAAESAAGFLLRSLIRDTLPARRRMPVDEWAEKHRMLPETVSHGHAGPYRVSLTPYVRRVLSLYAHSGVNWISLMWASQTSKSETCDTCKLYTIAEHPANTLVMAANIEDARDWNQDRFMPSLMACRAARSHLLPSPHETKTLKIKFDNCNFWFRGSNSKSGRRGKIAPRIFCDEVDSYADPEWIEVFDRVKAGTGDYKIFLTSTPDHENVGIHKFYQEGSQEKFYVPCPHCGTFQELVFAGLKWEGGLAASPDQAEKTARYQCQHEKCGRDIYNHHKPRMLAAGVWVPLGRDVDDVVENGEGSIGPGVERSHVSFHLSSLYSPFDGASFGKMAAKFITDGGMAESFCRGWLGQPWVKRGERLEDDELASLCIPEAKRGYRLGVVPDGVLAITRAIDVQKDHIWVEDRGWGAGGHSTWLINFMRVKRSLGAALSDISLPREYARSGSNETVPITAEFVDSGHFTDEVYQYVRAERAKGRLCYAVKGQKTASAMAQPWEPRTIEKWPDGTTMPGGLKLLLVNSDYWKTAAASRIRAAREAPGGIGADPEGSPAQQKFYLPENKHGCLHTYIRQITSEHRVEDHGKDPSRAPKFMVYKWSLRPGRPDNHAWDCLCYNLAGADFLQVRNLGAEQPPQRAPREAEQTSSTRKRRWVSGAR